MVIKLILFVLALMLLTACTGTRDGRTAYYDPCEQMKVEAETADEIKSDMRHLSRSAYPDPAPDVIEDTVGQAAAESLLVEKEDLLAMTMQSMQQNAQACANRSRGYDEDRNL
jgi:hypothetical protein